MTTIEERLGLLEARNAISELRSTYCWYTARGMRDELVGLFTDDGLFENARSEGADPVRVHGRAQLLDYFARMKPARRIPLVMN